MNIIKALEVFKDKIVSIDVTTFPKGCNFFFHQHYKVIFRYQDSIGIKYNKENIIMGEMIKDMVCCDFMLIDWAKEFNDFINEKSTDINTDAPNQI